MKGLIVLMAIVTRTAFAAAPPPSELPMAPFVSSGVPGAAVPAEERLKTAEGILDLWRDEGRITTEMYAPLAAAQVMIATLTLWELDGTDAARAEALSILGTIAARQSGLVGLTAAGVALDAVFAEGTQDQAIAFVRTLEQLPTFISAHMPQVVEVALRKNPKDLRALRARGRWALDRLDPAAAKADLTTVAAGSEDEQDHLQLARAVVLTSDEKVAAAHVRALVARFPDLGFECRSLMRERERFAQLGEPGLKGLGALLRHTGPTHFAFIEALARVEKSLPPADGMALRTGWFTLVAATQIAIDFGTKNRGKPLTTAIGIGAQVSSTFAFAIQQLFGGDPGIDASLAELDRLLVAAKAQNAGPFFMASAEAWLGGIRRLLADEKGKALLESFRAGTADTAGAAAFARGILEPLAAQFKNEDGPKTTLLVANYFADAKGTADTFEADVAALDAAVRPENQNRLNLSLSQLAMLLGRQLGDRPALYELGEARAMRVVTAMRALDAAARKDPTSTETCPDGGCTSAASAYALAAANRIARRFALPESERADWDSATVALLREGERWLDTRSSGLSRRHAELMSLRCATLFRKMDIPAAEQCVSDLFDRHRDTPIARVLVASLIARIPERMAEAATAFEQVVRDDTNGDGLRYEAAKWRALIAHATGDMTLARDMAREGKALREKLMARTASFELLPLVIDSNFQVGLGFDFDNQLLATYDLSASIMGVFGAPVDDLELDKLLQTAE
ncbi:MAG: hypothetical protein IV100_14390 [Myxococcales bacterium]|nr:hypothetical protein [Myxococcales bacterium]